MNYNMNYKKKYLKYKNKYLELKKIEQLGGIMPNEIIKKLEVNPRLTSFSAVLIKMLNEKQTKLREVRNKLVKCKKNKSESLGKDKYKAIERKFKFTHQIPLTEELQTHLKNLLAFVKLRQIWNLNYERHTQMIWIEKNMDSEWVKKDGQESQLGLTKAEILQQVSYFKFFDAIIHHIKNILHRNHYSESIPKFVPGDGFEWGELKYQAEVKSKLEEARHATSEEKNKYLEEARNLLTEIPAIAISKTGHDWELVERWNYQTGKTEKVLQPPTESILHIYEDFRNDGWHTQGKTVIETYEKIWESPIIIKGYEPKEINIDGEPYYYLFSFKEYYETIDNINNLLQKNKKIWEDLKVTDEEKEQFNELYKTLNELNHEISWKNTKLEEYKC
jgi:hypothetical protein